MRAIMKRELRAYFFSPIGYVVVGVLWMLYGYYYYQVMRIGISYYISSVYGTMFIWSMMLFPILTMRSFSEEQRNKTDQALLTAPVNVSSIVLGKFLGAFLVYLLVLVGTLVPAGVISLFAKVNWAMVLGNFTGSLLYGAGMIAIGIFLSSLTQSQIVAAISTFGISILLLVIDQLTSVLTNASVIKLLNWISFNARYQPFTIGTFDLASIVFFISAVALFLFFTARKLESRRWG